MMGTYPVPPVRCSFFQKMKSAMSPSQKTGAEIPKRTKPIAARSATDWRRTAERTPIDTPTVSQMVAAPMMRSNVRGARSSIWLRTDTLLVNEKPSPGQP